MARRGPIASRRFAGCARRFGSGIPAGRLGVPAARVGGLMTDILRRTAHTWLPAALTAAVVGIGIAVATW